MSLSVFYYGTCICAFLCHCHSFNPFLNCLSPFLLSYLFQGYVACWNNPNRVLFMCLKTFKIALSWRLENYGKNCTSY